MPVVKHIPLRTCVACGKIKPQREMVRLVNSGETVEIDPGRKKSGRGAYICFDAECRQVGLKGNRLERTLRVNLTPEERIRLAEQLKEFCIAEGK